MTSYGLLHQYDHHPFGKLGQRAQYQVERTQIVDEQLEHILHEALRMMDSTHYGSQMIENHSRDRLVKEVLMMVLVMHTKEDDMVLHIEKTGILMLVVEIDVGGELTFILGLQVKQKKDGIFISQDKYVAEILTKFRLTNGKSASTPIDTEKPLLKDPDGEDVDVHIYRSMIGSLMYLTSSRPDIMFAVCTCARFQVTPKASHLHVVKRIFRYLKGKPHLGLWYLKYSPFDLVAYSNSDYASASLDRKSTTGGCQFLGVNTPRCDEDMLDLMEFTVFLLPNVEKVRIRVSDVDLQVSAVRLMLLLLVQKFLLFEFWTTVAVKKVNDVTRLQALVDKKKVVVTKAMIREALRLDDAKGVECLPNEEIFTELARLGYEKPSTKLTFYKAFFSSQWKFLIQTILQCMSAKRTSLNEFSSSMASAVICLSSGKGFSGVDTPLFEGMLVAQEVEEGDADEVHDENVSAGDAVKRDVSAANDEVPTVAEEPSIPSPTPPTPPPQPSQYIPSTSQGRMIDEMDQDADVVLEEAKEVADDAKAKQDAKVDESVDIQGRQAESQAEIYKINLDHANKVLSIQEDESEPAKVQEVVDVLTTANLITEVVTVADHVKKKAKEDPAVKRYQALKRKPHTEAQARKNMMIYLKNVAGFKMDYFKGMSYDDIRPIFEAKFNTNVAFLQKTKEQINENKSRALKRINETPAEKAAKRKKLDEELDIHAQIWKTQRSVYGSEKVKSWKLLESCGVQIISFTTTQLILLVEKKYPLTKFTLDQMLNAVQLEVEEESEVSLELLRFIQQQYQEGA
nr:hypothetical protein [Tanacetum cinerariifolium]